MPPSLRLCRQPWLQGMGMGGGMGLALRGGGGGGGAEAEGSGAVTTLVARLELRRNVIASAPLSIGAPHSVRCSRYYIVFTVHVIIIVVVVSATIINYVVLHAERGGRLLPAQLPRPGQLPAPDAAPGRALAQRLIRRHGGVPEHGQLRACA